MDKGENFLHPWNLSKWQSGQMDERRSKQILWYNTGMCCDQFFLDKKVYNIFDTKEFLKINALNINCVFTAILSHSYEKETTDARK